MWNCYDNTGNDELDELVYNTYINLTPTDHEPMFINLNSFREFIETMYCNVPAPHKLLNGTLTKEDIFTFGDDLCGMYECGIEFQYIHISTENKLEECIKKSAKKLAKKFKKQINVLNHYEYCKIGSYFIFILILYSDEIN